jgi:hypothetical protein
LKNLHFFKELYFTVTVGDLPLERAQVRMTLFRKGGLASCMLLALLAGTPVGFSSPAYALPGGAQTGGLNIGQIVSALSGGTSPSTVAGATSPPAGTTQPQWTQILGNLGSGLTGGTISPTAATGLLSGLTGGSITPGAATALAGASGLGNMTSASQFLSNPSVQQALNQAVPGAGSVAAIAQVAMNPSALSNPATAKAIGDALGQALGIPGLGNILQGLMGGGATPPKGTTQQPKSPQDPISKEGCGPQCSFCQQCRTDIPNHYTSVRAHTQAEFQKHRNWLVNTYWLEHVLPALQLMAAQLTAVGIMQIQMVGAIFDAKHQLETQRLFQQMMAQAHKDYQPSEGMCTFGTTVRSLAGSERRSNIAQVAFAQRMIQRQALSGDVTSVESLSSDKRSRMALFLKNYCDQADNANGLGNLCRQAVATPARRNIDVDYTRNIESRLTLDVSFIPDTAAAGGAAPAAGAPAAATPDEEDVFSLAANLFSHNIAPIAQPELLAVKDGRVRMSNVEKYMDLRAIFAKRSVAQNSFAAITAQRAAGAPESAPYTKAILKELGVQNATEIDQLLGKNPSYFAQMEILTKKIYQNPLFYTELYDKPVNVARKGAAMQAIGLMQDRDLYNSLLRSEVVLSVLLETMLQKEQDKVANEGPKRNPAGGQR